MIKSKNFCYSKTKLKGGKMKKNLIFGISLVLVVLMASGVFAGWFGLTGNALRTGEKVAEDSSLIVGNIEENKVRIGNEIYFEGEKFSDSGKTYEVKAVEKKAWFFGSDKVVIEEVEEEPVPVETCTDSDGGLNYYVKGKIEDKNPTASWDICYTLDSSGGSIETNNCSGNNCYVSEQYCQSPDSIYGSVIEFQCPNGCVDGACVGEKPIPSEVTYEGVLKMLGSCEIKRKLGPAESVNCYEICREENKTCIASIFSKWQIPTPETNKSSIIYSKPINCKEVVGVGYLSLEALYCTCCSTQ